MGHQYTRYIIEYSLRFDSFLELGIGFGETIRKLSQSFDHLTVIEAEQDLVDRYLSTFTDIDFVSCDFFDFATSSKFSNIGMGFILDLIDDPIRLLKHYADFLAKNGRLFISVGNAASLHRLLAYHAGYLKDLSAMSNYHRAFGHRCYLTYEDWVKICTEAGYNVVAAHGLMLKPFTTDQIDALHLDDEVYKALGVIAKDLPSVSNAVFLVLEKK